MTPATTSAERFQPIAGLMAIGLPGLGYLWFGQPLRGLYVFLGVMGLFFGGILLGGIDTIDRKEDKWWFLLQSGVGPTALVINHVHQTRFKDAQGQTMQPDPQRNPGNEPPRNLKSVGRVNEVAMLMAAIAGMLNLIAIVDCVWHRGPSGASGASPTLRVGGGRAPGSEKPRSLTLGVPGGGDA